VKNGPTDEIPSSKPCSTSRNDGRLAAEACRRASFPSRLCCDRAETERDRDHSEATDAAATKLAPARALWPYASSPTPGAARRIERGEFPICPRCGLPIGPDQEWDLGHDDWNPRIERPEHRACNRAAANQLKTSRES